MAPLSTKGQHFKYVTLTFDSGVQFKKNILTHYTDIKRFTSHIQ